MSLGYLPDDEENPIEGPAAPGSADDFIAGVNAQPLAAPIAPEITDETAWPPPVPAEAPGMVPPPVPGAPIQPPGAPVQPAPGPTDAAPPATGSIADITGAAGASEKARAASDQAQIDLMSSGAPANAQLADIAKEKRENALLQQADNEEKMRQYDAADAEAQKQIAQAQEAKRNFKFKDFWADKSTARRIGSALAVAFGAYGAAMTHTQNYALEILNKEMDDDHRRQVEDLQRLNDNEVMATTGLQDARAARVRALQDIGLKAADADKVIAAKADEVAAISRDEQQKAALSAFAAKLRQDAADKTLQTRIGLRNAILAGNAGELKNAELQAHARLLNAQADAGGFAYRHGRPGAGGGGGGGHSEALQDLIDKKSPAEVQAKYKLSDKALANLMTTAGKAAATARGDQRAGLQEQRQLAKEASEWAKTNNIPALVKKQDELSAVLEEVKNAPHNPLQQALAVEKAVSSARGGAASRQALDLALHHLGGKWDSIESMVQGAKDGELGQKQMDNFLGFMTNQLGTAQAEGKRKYDEFNKFVDSQPAARRDEILASRGRIFSGLHGFGGQPKGGGGASIPPGAKVGTKGGVRGYMLDGKFTPL